MVDIRATIDGDEPCGVELTDGVTNFMCGRPRSQHWGRRNGLAPQKLGHQWRPIIGPKPIREGTK